MKENECTAKHDMWVIISKQSMSLRRNTEKKIIRRKVYMFSYASKGETPEMPGIIMDGFMIILLGNKLWNFMYSLHLNISAALP